ncbi:hypothetical protein, partial [Chamaesiphon sp. OTE_75_metabat_556]|uniref:hypothetical protein n=1 Tax=Chamaesiphon sp. OTE_75_metabat_556 TaxID=2964692 RepID=UPI00286C839C
LFGALGYFSQQAIFLISIIRPSITIAIINQLLRLILSRTSIKRVEKVIALSKVHYANGGRNSMDRYFFGCKTSTKI